VLSILLFFRRNWWPHGEVLGYVADLDGWHNVERYPEAEQAPEVVVYRWEAPLFFANSGIFRQQVRRLVRRRKPRWVVLQCEAVTDIDVTAADMLERLDRELNAQGVNIAFVELRSRLQDLILRYGLLETLDQGHFYPSVVTALEAIATEDRAAGSDEASGAAGRTYGTED
jgi:MFS superfamily sulfate permease-like transporter